MVTPVVNASGLITKAGGACHHPGSDRTRSDLEERTIGRRWKEGQILDLVGQSRQVGSITHDPESTIGGRAQALPTLLGFDMGGVELDLFGDCADPSRPLCGQGTGRSTAEDQGLG
jgi:hypothetical protein